MIKEGSNVELSIIVAVDQNNLIGSDSGGLPWKPVNRDKEHFRKYVKGKALLLGRKTFEEMNGWFNDDHTPFVLTRNNQYEAGNNVIALNTIEEIINFADEEGIKEIVVCGGAEIYKIALKYANLIIVTVIDDCFDANDASKYFASPEVLYSMGFKIFKKEKFPKSEKNYVGMSILWLRSD